MNRWSKRARRTSFGWAAAGIAVVAVLAAGPADAQETAAYFQQNCVSCHTIGGGRLTGPDLKDVTERRDREWLKSYILNPQAMMDRGDPIALQLLDEARGVVMPIPPGITPERVGYLLELIEAESALEESQFKGIQISNEPFTAADVARGLAIFNGSRGLKNGGPACFSCHSVSGLRGLGGGNLDPERGDLTLVYERLQGRVALSAWLMAPATPTMNAVFKDTAMDSAEIHSLVALFEDRAQGGKPARSQAQLTFALLGVAGAALVLMLFDFLWKGRFLAVRRPLVDSEKL